MVLMLLVWKSYFVQTDQICTNQRQHGRNHSWYHTKCVNKLNSFFGADNKGYSSASKMSLLGNISQTRMWASVNPYESLISNYEQFGLGGMYLPVEWQQSPASLRQYVMLRKGLSISGQLHEPMAGESAFRASTLCLPAAADSCAHQLNKQPSPGPEWTGLLVTQPIIPTSICTPTGLQFAFEDSLLLGKMLTRKHSFSQM